MMKEQYYASSDMELEYLSDEETKATKLKIDQYLNENVFDLKIVIGREHIKNQKSNYKILS